MEAGNIWRKTILIGTKNYANCGRLWCEVVKNAQLERLVIPIYSILEPETQHSAVYNRR